MRIIYAMLAEPESWWVFMTKPRMPLEPKPPRAEPWKSFEDDTSLSLDDDFEEHSEVIEPDLDDEEDLDEDFDEDFEDDDDDLDELDDLDEDDDFDDFDDDFDEDEDEDDEDEDEDADDI